MDETTGQDDTFLRPLVSNWQKRIQLAWKAKETFTRVGEQCNCFYSGETGFMWKDDFIQRFRFGIGNTKPKFQITIAKAFELVAIIGPTLYWRNPQRVIKTRKFRGYNPSIFGNPEDPMVQQQLQMMGQMDQQAMAIADARAGLMEEYLNYTPIEQPDGGLSGHATLAITEAIIKGRGVLWTEPYRMPLSDKVLTGSFYDSVDNLLIDPDADTLADAMWIAKKCCHPYWQVERTYGLEDGSLKKYAGMRSADMQAETMDQEREYSKDTGKESDLVTYYKIWSKSGIGIRHLEIPGKEVKALDDIVGDYAFMAIIEGVPYPLNASPDRLMSIEIDPMEGETQEQADMRSQQQMKMLFDWPFQTYKDNRWPCAILDFYPRTDSVWPIAPMAPGLGELYFMNILTSHLANRIWRSSRDFIAITRDAGDDMINKIKNGEDLEVLKLDVTAQKSIKQMVEFLQHPPTNMDAFQILDRISEQFEKRVGLVELAYGLNAGAASRTASDSKFKQRQVSIRPEHMAQQVESWMEEIAQLEKIAAYSFVNGDSLRPLLGVMGSEAWKRLIETADEEFVMREMSATVAAGSARKPNKDRDNDNMNAVIPMLAPILSQYAQISTDPTPINELVRLWGEAIDMDANGIQMQAWTPPPPPPEQQQAMAQQQQMMMQMEQEKMQLEREKMQADIQKSQTDVQLKQMDMQLKQIDQQGKQVEQVIKAQVSAQELRQDQAKHSQNLYQDQERFNQNLVQDEQKHVQEMAQKREELKIKLQEMKARKQEQRKTNNVA